MQKECEKINSVNHTVEAISTRDTQDNPPVRKILVFVIVALALLMTTIDSTIVATALDTLQEKLHTTINWVGWTLTAYSFGFVLMLPVSAKLSMRFGHRKVFMTSIITFTIASLCCGLANNIYVLIALRVIQAIGGAGITPSVTGIIVDHFGKSRDRAVSLFGSIFPVGAMIGPIFGGFFVTYMTWREIFFVNVPIGLAVILLAWRYVPRDLGPRAAKEHFDLGGVVLLGIGILAAMFAASYLGEGNTHVLSYIFVGLLVVAALALRGFFRHIKRKEHPFIMPRFIYGKGFGVVNLINVLYSGATQGVIALIPLYAANRYGISALDSSTLLVAEGVAAVTLSTVVTMVLRRTGYRPPLFVGCVLIILGIVLLALPIMEGISPYLWLAIASFLIGAGGGTISPPGRNAGLQLAPESSSTIAALRSMCIQLGSIISIAIATAVIADSHGSGTVQAYVYMVIALVFFVLLPIIQKIPEHHGAW